MNIYDIAKQANVSIATVSRVLNGKGNVSEKTRRQVLQVMEESGYQPNVFARGLGLNTMRMVGVICSDVSDIYYATAVSILERELRQHGYDSILCCTGEDLEDKRKCLNLLLQKRVDAIILVGSKFREKNDNSHLAAAAQRVPLILINGLVEIPNVYSVVCDNFNAVRESTCSLLEQGLTKILYLYDTDSYSGSLKLDGYQTAFVQHGLAASPAYMLRSEHSIAQAKELVSRLWKKDMEIQAILTSDDILAVGALKASLEAGKQIPQQLQIIGFNNSLYARASTPELSSIDSKVENLSITAVRTLIDVFSHKNVSNRVIVSAELVKRQTSL